jgi:LacI family transcriptional regulator
MLSRRLKKPSRKQEVIRITPSGVIPRFSSDSRSVESVFVSRIIHTIRANLHNPLEPNDVAKALRCSRRWLDYECMRTLKHSCFDEITIQRILRAKQLLADTDFPVASIGAQVGLTQMPRFFRQFKAYMKETPAAYRNPTRNIQYPRGMPHFRWLW